MNRTLVLLLVGLLIVALGGVTQPEEMPSPLGKWVLELTVRKEILGMKERMRVSNHHWGLRPDPLALSAGLPMPVAEYSVVFVLEELAAVGACRYSLPPRLESEITPESIGELLGTPPYSVQALSGWEQNEAPFGPGEPGASLRVIWLPEAASIDIFREQYTAGVEGWTLALGQIADQGGSSWGDALKERLPVSPEISSLWAKPPTPLPDYWTDHGEGPALPQLRASHPLEREAVCGQYRNSVLRESALLPLLFPAIEDLATAFEVTVWDGEERRISPY